MQYDRQITISAAGNRRAARWPAQVLWWSEFVLRLSTAVRGTETLVEYLRMPKSRQDDLKDIGGFVGGTLAGDRRKSVAVMGRDLVTLDLDAIPAMATDDVLRRIGALGCAYAVYSTRKHEPARPRLRVVLPLSRTVTADEYEPIARKLAEMIDIDWCDPTTFQPVRMMYWPSCCADSQYIYRHDNKPFVDADGVLALYQDWHDTGAWPRVPSEPKAAQRTLGKQEDPTAKKGIVGAFCRVYDVYKAMDAFLPGVYEPVDTADGRYTFTGGSTTGGAVVYDDGKYLYSHHATDPCGGQLVNAFDLVRLHLYAALDDDAKDGTPTGKLPSYMAMRKMAMEDQEVSLVMHKERGEAALQGFEMLAESSLNDQLATYLGGISGRALTTSVVCGLLDALGITIRQNIITGDADVSGYPASWSRENAENNLPTLLLDLLKPAGAKGATKSAVCDCLDLLSDEHRYNPVIDLFRSCTWDGVDRTVALFDILGIDALFDAMLVYKWLLQTVAMACNDTDRPYGADGVLTLVGDQGTGKTSFFRVICPIPSTFKEGAMIDPRNKDTITQATSHWICELGELERTTGRDHSSLKAIITAECDQYRSPYARKAIKRVRRTSFCGTVNKGDFLIDDTGNRRFWTVHVDHIDLPRLFVLTAEWKTQLWAQLYVAFQKNPQGFRLTGQEREMLNARNAEHTRPLDYELEVRALLDFSMPLDEWSRCQATDVAKKLCPIAPANRVGRVLSKLSKEDGRISGRLCNGCATYFLPLKKGVYGSGVADLYTAPLTPPVQVE